MTIRHIEGLEHGPSEDEALFTVVGRAEVQPYNLAEVSLTPVGGDVVNFVIWDEAPRTPDFTIDREAAQFFLDSAGYPGEIIDGDFAPDAHRGNGEELLALDAIIEQQLNRIREIK